MVRAHFIARGTSFSAWAISKGFNRMVACAAVHGSRRGPRTRLFIKLLTEELQKQKGQNQWRAQ